MENSSSKRRLPTKVFIFMLLTYLIPFFFFGAISIYSKAMVLYEAVYFLSNPIFFIFLFLAIVLPMVTYIWMNRNIVKFNGSEESLVNANKVLKKAELISVATPIVMHIICPILLTIYNQKRGRALSGFGQSSYAF